MFERLKVLYECAITAYQQITKTWFAPFIGRLHRAATLPARITIDVDLNSSKADPIGDPLLRIQWEPLEFGSRIEVAVAHGSVKFFTFESERSSRLQELILRLRPDQSESLGTLLCHDRASDFFFDYPIRKTVFSWLEEDLKRISWLHH
jgi:hypothetical protein